MRFKRLKALKIAIQSAWEWGSYTYDVTRQTQEEIIKRERKKVFK